MDTFGCCSSYIECSNARVCLHASDPEYGGCAYRANLDAGIVFYAKHSDSLPEAAPDKSIFLHCMNRVFAIYARQNNQWSIDVSHEQIKAIEAVFIESGIPYKTMIDSMDECKIDMPTDKDPFPANSRVVFEVGGQEYHVLNFNSWLIKRATAERIAKAFDNHFIPARVELRGKHSYSADTRTIKPVRRPVAPAEPQKIIEPKAQQSKPTQVSIFDLCKQQLSAELQDTGREIQKINICHTLPAAPTNDISKIPDLEHTIRTDLIIPGAATVIADDKYCGSYLGELVNTRTMQMNYKFAHVRIIEMLRYPRQDAIFNPSAIVKREPYEVGSVHSFDLADIRFIFNIAS